LPAPGQLELELGGLATQQDGGHRASLPYTLKLGFTPQWGVEITGEALVSQRDGDADGVRRRGVGDTTLVLKRAFLVDDATAFGVELAATAPTARAGIGTGSGKADYTVNGIVSRDLGAVHLDANLNLIRLGDRDTAAARTQQGLAAALSTPLSAQWGATAELSGTRQRGAASTAQLLLATTYSPTRQLVIDLGLARGLNRASPDWSLFSGVVLPLARLW
jgi:hypothetical protein